MTEAQYVVLDAAPVLKETPRPQLGPALAQTIRNTPWFHLEADSRFDRRVMDRLIRDVERSRGNRFSKAWDEFKDYASSHNIWINED